MRYSWPNRSGALRRIPSLGLALAPTLAVALLTACSDSSSPPPPPREPTVLQVVEGQGLQAPTGTILPEGPTVRVLDQEGAPLEGAVVRFQVVEGGGTALIETLATNGAGLARTTWVLGTQAGVPQRLRASVEDLSQEFQAQAILPLSGNRYQGRQGYVEYYPGEGPIVISAPHGGRMTPAEIPDRTWGTVGEDRNTADLAYRIREAVRARTGAYPHLVVSNLARVKLDPNREIVEASQGDPESERAWWEYHTFIHRASDLVEEAHGVGFYIDLHGHGHEIQRLELGYMLSSTVLTYSDEDFEYYAVESSMRSLASKPGISFAELIRGPGSLGALFENRGVPAVPSLSQPHPGGQPFFSGGYSTGVHGSRDGGAVDGVQIECHFTGLRDTEANRSDFAEKVADVLVAFFQLHHGMSLDPLAAVAEAR